MSARSETIDAATVVLVRDATDGIETLMLRRNSKLDFVGGMWVFPGGRVDPEDREGVDPHDALQAARRAAAREAHEESGLTVSADAMIEFAHWTPPPIIPRRFLTWFFIAAAPAGSVTIDFGEIHDHDWMRPEDALRRRDAKEIELAPPTWVTLNWLSGFADVQSALADAEGMQPERFSTHIARVPGGTVALWHGDAGYDASDPDAPGPRHRLWMLDSGWRYEKSS